MSTLPQLYSCQRAPRVRPNEITPAVLQFRDGHHASGELRVISSTGGLLCLHQPIDQGSLINLMLMSHGGAVFAAAEMLRPVAKHLQPFRFACLPSQDELKLKTAIQSFAASEVSDQEWMEKLRTAKTGGPSSRSRRAKIMSGAIAVGIICIASALCALRFHLF